MLNHTLFLPKGLKLLRKIGQLIKEILSILIRWRIKRGYQQQFSKRIYYIMRRPAEVSQYYGVEVSDYNINTLRNKELVQREHSSVNIGNAHIYAFAYQQGFNVPSEARIAKTVQKNTSGAELTVYRLDRIFRNYDYNIYKAIFRKPKKVVPAAKPKKIAAKQESFQVHSPEQIVIKCARQAYVRQILGEKKLKIRTEARVPSEQEAKRRQHQKQRRLQRTLILKAYKHQLFNIFGQIIFRRGWKISREQLKQKLQLPPESYGIEVMKAILWERQIKAVLYRQRLFLKRKAYEKIKLQRLKMLKYLRRYQRRIYVPHSEIQYPHKEEDIYDNKCMHQLKSKQSKVEGERVKKMKKRKMIKQKVWYRQNDRPNSKQIKKQIDESSVWFEEEEDNELESVEQAYQLVAASDGQKELRATEQ